MTVLFGISLGCDDNDPVPNPVIELEDSKIRAVDISSFPEINDSGTLFYDAAGNSRSFLDQLLDHGVNTVRLRLWVDPVLGRSGLDEVAAFSSQLKAQGFKIWLSIHYSDTWADPGHQELPAAWRSQTPDELVQTVYTYTSQVMTRIDPDYVQIGNEVNTGMLHPLGDISLANNDFLRYLSAGCQAVRDESSTAKIIIHYAGIHGSTWFYDQVATIDYDIIGLSYYPIWHGKSLNNLESSLQSLSTTFNKDILIAETAYPFTLDYNDFTNNIVGLDSQLILPQFPATPQGQLDFINAIRSISTSTDKTLGFCYWGAELVAWKGPQSMDASPWENQALFDFNNQALPVLQAFNK